MKKVIFFILLAGIFANRAEAQHTVTLSWTLSIDDTTANCATPNTCSETVYRAPGACSATSAFAAIGGSQLPTVITFTDSAVVPGVYCYAVSFTQNGLESAKDSVTVTLPPAQPSGITASKT